MNTNNYYFPDCIEDDLLSVLAVQAKELLDKYKYVIKIFALNTQELYSESPSQALFLMKQNNKTIFSSNLNSDSSPTDLKSYQGLSTSVSRNSDILNEQRRNVSLGDADKQVHPSSKLETSTSISETAIMSPGNQKKRIPIIDIATSSDEDYSSPTDSTSSFVSVTPESLHSAEVVKMNENLSMAEKEFESPSKLVGYNNRGDQESHRYVKLTRVTSNAEVHGKMPRRLFQNVQTVDDSAINKDYLSQIEKAKESDKSDSTIRDSISKAKGIVNISESTRPGIGTLSPTKRYEVGNSSCGVIKELGRNNVKVLMSNSSSDDTKANANSFLDEKKNKSPNEPSKGIPNGTRKRKSFTPKKICILKVTGLDGKTEIKVPCDTVDRDSPTTFQSSPSDYASDSKKDSTGNPVVSELRAKSSIKVLDQNLTHPEARISTANVSMVNIPSSDNAFAEKDSSCIPLVGVTETCEKSCESEDSYADIDDELNQSLIKFNSLIHQRNEATERMFSSFKLFQSSVKCLCGYVHNIRQIIMKIDVSDKIYLTNELKEIVSGANEIVLKLTNKLNSFQTNVKYEVDTSQKYLQQIKQLKEKYEPFTKRGKLIGNVDALQEYESQIKTIWKKLDEMILLNYSRRVSFSQMAFDFLKLTKYFFRCLVLVGIVLVR